ncbi:MAG: DUF3096 domain-containing protein [Nanoarchaeota archaeon]
MVAISFVLSGLLALVLGILVLVFPRLLRWAIGLYLIVFGVLQLLGQYFPQFSP